MPNLTIEPAHDAKAIVAPNPATGRASKGARSLLKGVFLIAVGLALACLGIPLLILPGPGMLVIGGGIALIAKGASLAFGLSFAKGRSKGR